MPPHGANRTKRSSRLAGFLTRYGRTWRIQVPLHLIAFLILYIATLSLSERASLRAGFETSELMLAQLVDAFRLNPSEAALPTTPHQTLDTLLDHESLDLRLLDLAGRPLVPEVPGQWAAPADVQRLQRMLASDDPRDFWTEKRAGRTYLRGLKPVVGDGACTSCHAAGQAIAVASIGLDFTDHLAAIRRTLRRNFALLLIAWASMVGASTFLVRRSASRAARRLEADLDAAAAGEPGPGAPSAEVALDPVSAELHEALRRYLRQQREREAEVATRLAHTDQLARIGKLAAGLAHEIKNPLAGIQGALEILRDDLEADPSRSELCGEVLSELRRVNEILQTLLASARPGEPRIVAVDLKRLLRDIQRLLGPSLSRDGVRLETEIAPDAQIARIDADKIRQVLVNLIQNAAEAIDGEGRVVVRAAPLPERHGLVIAVQDDGPGIAEENLRKIFDPFFSTKFTGTGLGLAIARSLVNQHGGSLEAESVPGGGSTFFIILPQAKAVREPIATSEMGVV